MYRIQNREFTLKKFVTAKERKDSYVFLAEAYKAVAGVKDKLLYVAELFYPDELIKDNKSNFEYWFKNLLDGDFEGIDFNDENYFPEYEEVGEKVLNDFFALREVSKKQ